MKKREIKIFNVQLDWYSQVALFCLILIVLTGLFSTLLATSKPWYINHYGNIHFPAIEKRKTYDFSREPDGYQTYQIENINWEEIPSTKKIFAPIPYDAGQSDRLNSNFQPPFTKTTSQSNQFRHWLGTNLKGDDLLSGIIHGTSVSLKIGFFSILLAVCLGTFAGMIAGFYQNDTWKVPLLCLPFMMFSIVPSFYLADLFNFFAGEYIKWENTLSLLGSIFIYAFVLIMGMILSYWTGNTIHLIFRWKKKIMVPVDIIVSKIIEVFAAIPKLMLVVALAAILDRSVTNVILVIALCAWAGIARLVRGEVLKIRNTDFITSAKALGLSNYKIIIKHILPNIAGPIIVTFVFGLSSAILIESGLSFLNIGVPENVITWGQLLADGKQNFNAWWMIVFPGFAIFITVLCLNVLGEKFKAALSPSNRGFS